jgi:APA family basic amino acid/polyamine antiporter
MLSRRNVPAIGLAVQGVWSILLCLSGTYSDLLDYVIFAVMIFNVLIISAIYILRKKRPEAERPYKAFGYPVLPAVYVVFSLFVMLMLFFISRNLPGLD